MNENITVNAENIIQKKIGNTTYIVTSRFNGDNQRNITTVLVRLIERELTNSIPPKIGA